MSRKKITLTYLTGALDRVRYDILYFLHKAECSRKVEHSLDAEKLNAVKQTREKLQQQLEELIEEI